MKYKCSRLIINQNELGKLEENEYLKLLKFAFANSDMISLSTNQMSLEKAVKVVEKYAPSLVDEIVDSELTHETHCTKSRNTMPIFYFRLSKTTKEFLKTKKTLFDFVFNGNHGWLDDLAFYQNSICWLSTCTHENVIGIDGEKLKEFQRMSRFASKNGYSNSFLRFKHTENGF